MCPVWAHRVGWSLACGFQCQRCSDGCSNTTRPFAKPSNLAHYPLPSTSVRLMHSMCPNAHTCMHDGLFSTCSFLTQATNSTTHFNPHNTGLSENIAKDFLLGHVIGQGSYGLVKYAWSKQLGTEVAVKVLSKRRGNKSTSRTLRKLEREIDIHSTVQDCPNVVQLYDAYEDAANVYLVMEFVQGKTLEKHLVEHGALSEYETALVMRECLKVLAACHSRSILHGDIKGQNFLLSGSGTVAEQAAADSSGLWLRAIDLGCSQRYRGIPFATRVGTPVFMAPEVWSRHFGLEADMWSLGMLFYELLAARFPYWDTLDECKTRTLDEVMKAVIVEEVTFDYGPWRTLSPAGLDFVQSLLQRDPAVRLTVADALRHPWLAEQLGKDVVDQRHNNILPYGSSSQQQQHKEENLASGAACCP